MCVQTYTGSVCVLWVDLVNPGQAFEQNSVFDYHVLTESRQEKVSLCSCCREIAHLNLTCLSVFKKILLK